jgi:tripartite-type tricarboxylate transporter receptor subunit TctC
MLTRRDALSLGLAAAFAGVAGTASAQSTPGGRQPVRILVGFPPGGTADVLARALAPKLAREDSTVIVENKPGAGGRLAVTQMLGSPADARTVLMTADPILVIYPHVFRKLAYRTDTDIVPVAPVASEPIALVVGPMVPASVTTLAQFADWCRKNPKDASYATAAAGTTMHFVGAMLARAERFDFLHVPHRGAAAALQDVMGGQMASTMAPLSQAVLQMGTGRLRVLAVSSTARSPRLPQVPTFMESGHKDMRALVYYGIYLRAGTPAAAVQETYAAVTAAARSPEFMGTLDKLALDAYSMDQAAFTALVKADLERWGPIVKATGYTAED